MRVACLSAILVFRLRCIAGDSNDKIDNELSASNAQNDSTVPLYGDEPASSIGDASSFFSASDNSKDSDDVDEHDESREGHPEDDAKKNTL